MLKYYDKSCISGNNEVRKRISIQVKKLEEIYSIDTFGEKKKDYPGHAAD